MPLARDSQGVLKFMKFAADELSNWYGQFCCNDKNKFAIMAAREWAGMAESERKPFLTVHKKARASNSSSNSTLGARFVVNQRSKLHKLHGPIELLRLEYMIKTRPKRPINAYMWYIKLENVRSGSEAKQQWASFAHKERAVHETCAEFDRKRYKLEKDIWITNMLQKNLPESTEFTLEDFMFEQKTPNIDLISSVLRLNKDRIVSPIRIKRPQNAFSLFLADHRFQTENERPRFQFREHLQSSAAAWAKLPETEKQVYREASERVKDLYVEIKSAERQRFAKDSSPDEVISSLFSKTSPPCGVLTKPNQLLTYRRMPDIYQTVSIRRGVSKTKAKLLWETLSDIEKASLTEEHKLNLEQHIIERDRLRDRLFLIKKLIHQSRDLETMKRKMGLLTDNRV